MMTQDENHYDGERNRNSSERQRDTTDRLDREKNPLPESISEYVQKVRDELKQYEEQKKFYEKRRKREIVLELVDLLEEHKYPKEWLRLIIAQELGDYISTSYIEKILAEKFLDKTKNIKEQSTRQTAEIPRIDDRIPIELSTTGESVVDNDDDDDPRNANPYNTNHTNTEVPTEFETELERQAETGVQEIVKKLQEKVRDLEAKCYQLDQLAQERSMWKEKYTQLQQEFSSYESKIIKGTTQIEFGSEFLPVKIEYNFKTNQFTAKIPEEVIERVLRVIRRQRRD